jgi:hypothetical protein
MDVEVVENADNCVHITMPAPPTNHLQLSDEELSNAAGGGGPTYVYTECANGRIFHSCPIKC